MTLSAVDRRILELARTTIARRTLMEQQVLAGTHPLETLHSLVELIDAGLLELEIQTPRSRGNGVSPAHYTTSRRGLELLDASPVDGAAARDASPTAAGVA